MLNDKDNFKKLSLNDKCITIIINNYFLNEIL